MRLFLAEKDKNIREWSPSKSILRYILYEIKTSGETEMEPPTSGLLQDLEQNVLPSIVDKCAELRYHHHVVEDFKKAFSGLKRAYDAIFEERDQCPLFEGITQGVTYFIQLLLSDGLTDVNLKYKGGLTPVQWAVVNNQPEIIEILLDSGRVKVNARTEEGALAAIHLATIHGHVAVLRQLLDYDGTDVNTQSVNGWTPLHYALALQEGPTILQLLLNSNNINVNVFGERRVAPLHLAAMTQASTSYDPLQALITKGAYLELPTEDGLTAFHLAAICDNHNAMTILSDNGANVNAKTLKGFTALHLIAMRGSLSSVKFICSLRNIQIDNRANDNRTALELAKQKCHDKIANFLQLVKIGICCMITAVVESDLKKIKVLVEEGQNVNAADENGSTFVHLAIRVGGLRQVMSLVEEGGDVTARNKDGDTPLTLSIKKEKFDVTKYLLEHGADPNEKGVFPLPIFLAVSTGHLDIVKYLVAKGADLKLLNDDGETILHHAVRTGDLDIIKYLVETGADVSAENSNGSTPLLLGAFHRRLDIMEYLLERGANPNRRNAYGITPLLYGAGHGYLDIVNCLVTRGVDVNGFNGTQLHQDVVKYFTEEGADVTAMCSSRGFNPLSLAVLNGRLNITEYLLEQKADPNTKDVYGWTPLFYAASSGRLDIVKRLLDEGADVNISSNKGETPLYEAAKNGHLPVVRHLVECGGDVSIQMCDAKGPLDIAREYHREEVVNYLKTLLEQNK